MATYYLLVPDTGRRRASQTSVTLRLAPDYCGRWGQGYETEIRRTYAIG